MSQTIQGIENITQQTYFAPYSSMDQSRLEAIARLYAEVFAGEPWFEMQRCPNAHCTVQFVDNFIDTKCRNCSWQLSEAYPIDEVVSVVKKETESEGGCVSHIVDEHGTPYGAGWGFSCRVTDLQEKYSTQEMKDKVASKVDTYAENGVFFYLSEMMVHPAARKKGYATKITQTLLDSANNMKLNTVLRTHYQSPMARISRNLGMDRILDPGEDSEHTGRVLYGKLRQKSSHQTCRF